MDQKPKTTLERIHEAAAADFLRRGFRKATLRDIAQAAGVTTGALYGYYDSKEQLFEALVGEAYDTMMNLCRGGGEGLSSLTVGEAPEGMEATEGLCSRRLLQYVYDHLTAFRLLLCCSDGTRFSGMIDRMVELGLEGTHRYQRSLQEKGLLESSVDPRLEHILVTGMVNAFFELVIHQMTPEQADTYLSQLQAFYYAGWKKILGC